MVTYEGILICVNEEQLTKANSPIVKCDWVLNVISINDEQSAKAFLSINFTEEGISILVNDEHSLKIDPISDIEDGIETSFNFVQPSKTPAPNIFKDDGKNTSVNDEQSLNAQVPIFVNVDGNIICFNDEHPSKQYSLISDNEFKNDTFVNDVQSLKAFEPISFTDAGIKISVNEQQSEKA